MPSSSQTVRSAGYSLSGWNAVLRYVKHLQGIEYINGERHKWQAHGIATNVVTNELESFEEQLFFHHDGEHGSKVAILPYLNTGTV